MPVFEMLYVVEPQFHGVTVVPSRSGCCYDCAWPLWCLRAKVSMCLVMTICVCRWSVQPADELIAFSQQQQTSSGLPLDKNKYIKKNKKNIKAVPTTYLIPGEYSEKLHSTRKTHFRKSEMVYNNFIMFQTLPFTRIPTRTPSSDDPERESFYRNTPG